MKNYEIGIVYRFQAENEDHAIEQFIDVVLSPGPDQPIELDLEGAITVVKEI